VLTQINGTPLYAIPAYNTSVVFAQEGLAFGSHVLSLSYGVSTPGLVSNEYVGFAVTGVEITMGDGDDRWVLAFTHVVFGAGLLTVLQYPGACTLHI
jgi:hypothetical protein